MCRGMKLTPQILDPPPQPTSGRLTEGDLYPASSNYSPTHNVLLVLISATDFQVI